MSALAAAALLVFAHVPAATVPLPADWGERARLGLTPELLDEWRSAYLPETVDPPQIESSSISTQSGGGRWEGLVIAHFPASEVATALRVIACESGGDPGARNPSSGAAGLFQIMPFWARHFGIPYDHLFAAEINAEIARRVWDVQGWQAWECY